MVKRTGITFFLLIVSLALFSFSPLILQAQSVQVAEVIHVTGDVTIKTAASPDWVSAEEGMKVKEGDIIKTEADSSAELAFGEKLSNVLNIFPNSQLVISRFEPGLVKLEQGRVFTLLRKLNKGSTFEVRTPTAVAGARGTGWGTSLNSGHTEIQDFENIVYIAGLDPSGGLSGIKDLIEGWKAYIAQDGRHGEFVPLTDDEKKAWKKWKEEALRRLRDYMDRRKNAGWEKDMDKLEHRAEMLNRIESETDRTEENKRDRRNAGGQTGEGGDYRLNDGY